MATLEDAAEQLVVKLKGLDSEIEESRHALLDLGGRVERASKELEEDWTMLSEAVSSFLDRLKEEQEPLAADTQEALRSAAEAGGAVQASGAEARSEVADGAADLEALAQHASGLEPGVATLVADGGEAPAHGLAERANEVDEQLAQVVQDACDFLRDEVGPALETLADEVAERARTLRRSLGEEAMGALHSILDIWEAKVEELEEYVTEEGFAASHGHARAVVDWALDECRDACEAGLASLQTLMEETMRPLKELGAELEQASHTLRTGRDGLIAGLDETRASTTRAAGALDRVRADLARYSFAGA